MSSYTYNSKTITPRTQSTFAVSQQSSYWKKATRTVEPAQAGVFTGYMNMVENTDVGMISIATPGHEFMVMANSTTGKVSYRIDATETATTISVTPQTWHQVKFVVGSEGVDGYWDAALIFHSDLGTTIESMSFGSAWSSAPCGYDDFSFLPKISGDANTDGIVNDADLSALSTNFGTPSGATWSMGDFNGDGAVDASDLNILATHYGESH
jgi:hypothetical protein